MTNSPTLCTLKIQLHGSEPLIWRRIEVDGAMTLDRFHYVLQGALGWTNSHLHQFMAANPYDFRSDPRREVILAWLDADSIAEGLDGEDETESTVAQAFERIGGTLWYQYDFGDSWVHRIELESTRAAETGEPAAHVLEGRYRVPLEDVGGLGGWYELLELDRSPVIDVDKKYMLDWLHAQDGYYSSVDPNAFSVDAANLEIALWAGASTGDWNMGLVDSLPAVVMGNTAGRWLSTVSLHAGFQLAQTLLRAGVNVLDAPGTPSMPELAPRAMASIMWWIEACAGEGLPLTAAGYLSPSIIPQVVEGIGWQKDDFVQYGSKTEANLHTLYNFRQTLIAVGLLKAQGRKLVATPAALRAAKDPAKLWAHLARRALDSKRAKVAFDATMLTLTVTADPKIMDPMTINARVNEGMRLLEYQKFDGTPIKDGDFTSRGARYTSIIAAFRMALNDGDRQVRCPELEREFALAVLRS